MSSLLRYLMSKERAKNPGPYRNQVKKRDARNGIEGANIFRFGLILADLLMGFPHSWSGEMLCFNRK